MMTTLAMLAMFLTASPGGVPATKDLTGLFTPAGRVLGPFHNLYNPNVLEIPGDPHPYRMWFFGYAVADSNPQPDGSRIGDAVYHARSHDFQHWEVYAGEDSEGAARWDTTGNPATWTPVLRSGNAQWDNAAVGDPSVVLDKGVFFMAFSSVGFDFSIVDGETRNYITNCVGGARSTDGIHWQRTPSPIAMWSGEKTNRWNIGADGKQGPPPGYQGSYHRPSLLRDDGRWRLWFDYYLPGTFVSMGYAECTGAFEDPAAWTIVRAGDAPLLKNWPNTAITKVGGRFYALSDSPHYDAKTLGGDGRLLTLAESKNGLDWTVVGYLRPEGRAASHVPEWFVPQSGLGKGWIYILYAWKPEAVSSTAWDYRYKEIRYMKAPIKSLP